jgi:hypothetical protein
VQLFDLLNRDLGYHSLLIIFTIIILPVSLFLFFVDLWSFSFFLSFPFFLVLVVSSLAYPNLLGTKSFAIVGFKVANVFEAWLFYHIFLIHLV